ncbi:general transcription factor II-I repeat domain-containing protein 2-like [Lampris incognitus]|uniref:general transcription factor II-I repeat domain-containing protein 2-like n=1 Tax=Lampris incognitus TaxID=2546036 RepID=UPI0024B48C1F|nr:general transcription factor II-I repeat domain-containing protein 2-like [Lampris incognitus]
MATKRKVDKEYRQFQERWEAEYLFCELKQKPACLVCQESLAVFKEHNIRRAFERKHGEQYANMDTEQRLQKAKGLKRNLQHLQSVFTRIGSESEGATEASCIIAEELAKASEPFSEGEFIKDCLEKVCNVVCPDKKQAFSNTSLSRNTVASRVEELASAVESQLQTKAEHFVPSSLAADESKDRTHTAQLSILIRGVDTQLSVTEELLDVKLVGLTRKATGHTGENLVAYHRILPQEALCCKVLGMEQVMTVVTNTVNFSRARGLNHRRFRALLEEGNSVREDVPYHTEVRWLSRGKVLRRFYDTRAEIARFMESKQKAAPKLEDEKWLSDLVFMCDITEHLRSLNLKLQGRKQLIPEMRHSVKAFELKLRLREGQMRKGNLTHFPTCQSMSATVTIPLRTQVYADKLNTLKAEFSRRFADFESQKFNLDLFANPSAIDVDAAPEHLQLELIELQCSSALKSQYQSIGAAEFAALLPKSMPELRLHAARIMSMFGSTYSCEQMFSIMNLNKTSHRSRLTDQHLVSVLKLATAKDIKPRIDEIISKKRCRVSGKS